MGKTVVYTCIKIMCSRPCQHHLFISIYICSASNRDIPKGLEGDFKVEDSQSEASMQKLKARIRTSGVEVYDDYPCQWGGMVDGRPVVIGLEYFGIRVLNNMWNAIQNYYPDEVSFGMKSSTPYSYNGFNDVYLLLLKL